MHIISRAKFNEACKKFPNHCTALDDTYRILKCSAFITPDEMRKVFKTLDNFKYRDKWWVIDIAGNHLRLIAFISFKINKVFVKHILTHAEYDSLTSQYRRNKK